MLSISPSTITMKLTLLILPLLAGLVPLASAQNFTGFVKVDDSPQNFTRISLDLPCPNDIGVEFKKEAREIRFTIEPTVSTSNQVSISMTPANFLKAYLRAFEALAFQWTDQTPITSPSGVRIQVPRNQLVDVFLNGQGYAVQILSGFTRIDRITLQDAQGVVLAATLNSTDDRDQLTRIEALNSQGCLATVESSMPVSLEILGQGNIVSVAAPNVQGSLNGQGNALTVNGLVDPPLQIMGQGHLITVPDCDSNLQPLSLSQGIVCNSNPNAEVTVEVFNATGTEPTTVSCRSGAIGHHSFLWLLAMATTAVIVT
jgi:hypothetical protein